MNRRSFLSALAAVVLVPQAKFDPFASGRMPLGKWFGSFGSGMAATLHGTEAIIAPHQTPIFIQNAVESRILLDGAEMKRWINREVQQAIDINPRGLRRESRLK